MSNLEVGTFSGSLAEAAVDVIVLPLFEDEESFPWPDLDAAADEALSGAFAGRAFRGKKGRCLAVALRGVAAPEAILVGLGAAAEFTPHVYRDAVASAAGAAAARRAESLLVAARADLNDAVTLAGAAAEAVVLGRYRFRHYKQPDDKATLTQVLVEGDAEGPIADAVAVSRAVNWARDLINLSPSDKRPSELADLASTMAGEYGLACEVIDPDRAAALEMGALLAVGQGSSDGPRLVILEHAPEGTSGDVPVALVGKGVTFDTGGISIKPSANMHEMKADMSGAAAVLATMRAIAEVNLPRRVVGLVPLAENMPDGRAYRPGDIVRAMNGKMIEVLNTDAEGRMILADALAYAVREFQPRCVVDLATLTGACVVALGEDVAGVMANDDDLRGTLVDAGNRVGEAIWPLPMFAEYDSLIKSAVGDIKNTGGRWGGAITAAKFLEHFVDETPWAHLDIAGPAYRTKARPTSPKGGAGFGVRLLVDWLRHTEAE